MSHNFLVIFCFSFINIAYLEAKDLTHNNPKTISMMHSVFGPMSELLPLSIENNAFSDPKNHDFILKQMQALVDGSGALSKHAQSDNKGFVFLASRLQRDARDMLKWFQKKRSDEARFILHNMTENCISCHSQWTSNKKVPIGTDFFGKADLAKLAPVQKAEIFVASRKFDDALTEFEKFFNSKDLTPSQIALSDAFTTYLKINLRVNKDTKRPKETLKKWLKRPGIPAVARGETEMWVSSLQRIDDQNLLTGLGNLEAGKKLIALGQEAPDLSLDRSKLVYFIAASGRLLEGISKTTMSDEDLSEAYYLLGLCESAIGPSYWISLSDSYFEEAIRTYPQGPVAVKALEALRTQLAAENESPTGGIDQENLIDPDNIKGRLLELSEIIKKSEKKSAPKK